MNIKQLIAELSKYPEGSKIKEISANSQGITISFDIKIDIEKEVSKDNLSSQYRPMTEHQRQDLEDIINKNKSRSPNEEEERWNRLRTTTKRREDVWNETLKRYGCDRPFH